MSAAEASLRPLPPLHGEQARASAPDLHVWLSASAGTGKTQVLAARVFRLLLAGTDPSAILCLTFTKAGAAEMAGRINARLAAWVRMPAPELGADLLALGERSTPDLQKHARTLFARVLDAPGGGIRIQTIHGFAQGLLAAFPVEAGLVPGFRPLDAREEGALAREALADLFVGAEREGRGATIDAVQALSLRLGEGGAEAFLAECARKPDAMESLPSGIQPWLRRQLDLPSGDLAAHAAAECARFDTEALRRLAAANAAWGTATGTGAADIIAAWLAGDADARWATIGQLQSVVFTAKGEPRKHGAKLLAAEPDYAELALELGTRCAALQALVMRAAYADLLAAALAAGRDYARAYQAAKRRAGAVDFDDLIRRTVALLEQPGIGEWVRFKLDQVTEHVLIDEAQDTNVAQWTIVRALVDEFFVGRGVHAPRTRTLFTVGDHKQAIFGFQGTDPINFAAAENFFAQQARAAYGDEDTAPADRGLEFAQLSLTASFRSTAPILAFVDAAIDALPAPALGTALAEPHASRVAGPGTVTLWPPVTTGGSDEDEEAWVDDAVREVARRIARQVKSWIGTLDLGTRGRKLRPEDVMILVKRRGELASLLVARLYAEGVPVAGVDRLRLNAPLAVQDLLAAVRFVLQPDDDLSLAGLLVSPLIGWTQDDLMHAAPRARGSLWAHLSATCADRLQPLRDLLAAADFSTPYRFLEAILSGPLDGRRKLIHRLGVEARDPIEELLSAALDFERVATPSLQRFLDWFDRGDVEIVRDPSAPLDAVRVMTAHGAKGLQAPLVILADATADPTANRRDILPWAPEGTAIPIFRPRAGERTGPLADVVTQVERRERAEHWRLFYVAATRAEEHLVIAGARGARAAANGPPAESWYAVASHALTALGVAEGEGERRYAAGELAARRRQASGDGARAAPPLPDWAHRPAPVEARPPRPLAPSSLGEDAVAEPPPGTAMRAAAERGRLIHALFERLPAVPASARASAAERWLAEVARVADAAERLAIAAPVLATLADPRFADVFATDALAEAPITAVLDDGTVVSGTVDRLCVGADTITVVDFKTGSRVPATADAAPPYHLRQMAAYAEALAAIFPDREVRAALLYTAGPVLHPLPPALLALHKPGLAAAEQS